MKLVRYELYADNEKQDVGIFQGLCEVFNGKTADKLCEPLDMNLPLPALKDSEWENTESWFTEYGDNAMLPYITKIIKAYEKTGLFEVRKIEIASSEIGMVIYKDKFQVVAKRNVL